MKRIFNIVFIAVILTSFLITIKKFYEISNKYRHEVESIKYKNNTLSYKLDLLNNYFVNQNNILPQTVINKLLTNNRDIQIVACYFKENCGACMKRLIIDLDDFSKRTNFHNINFIGDINANDFYYKMQINKEMYSYHFFEELEAVPNKYKDYPLLFVTYKGKIIHLFVPELLIDYNDIYFSDILNNLIAN